MGLVKLYKIYRYMIPSLKICLGFVHVRLDGTVGLFEIHFNLIDIHPLKRLFVALHLVPQGLRL